MANDWWVLPHHRCITWASTNLGVFMFASSGRASSPNVADVLCEALGRTLHLQERVPGHHHRRSFLEDLLEASLGRTISAIPQPRKDKICSLHRTDTVRCLPYGNEGRQKTVLGQNRCQGAVLQHFRARLQRSAPRCAELPGKVAS